MPYKVSKKGSKYCVIKSDDGSTVKCHSSKKDAIKHMQALNINVTKPELKKKVKKKSSSGYEVVEVPVLDAGVVAGLLDDLNVEEFSDELVTATEEWFVAAGAPQLVTVPNVPLMEAGVEYSLSTGPTTFTPEDLADAVTAANEDPSIPVPRLKLGHIDPRFDAAEFDATPSFGKATNLRLSENGMVVYADFVGVPKWLAEILPTAYPNRSIEGFWGVKSQAGKTWRFALTAVALLGVRWPGITMLEDLPAYYGEEVPEGVEVDAELVAAGSGKEDDVMDPAKAAANLDDIRRAFYSNYVPDHKSEGAAWWWIRAVMTDPNQLVIEDDNDGQLYLLSFSSDAKGGVSFGDPSPVRIDYVPDDRKKEAASFVAAALLVGQNVAASWSSRDDSIPETPVQGGQMDPKEIRKRLGLQEDATDEQVQQAVLGLAAASGLFNNPGDGNQPQDPPIPAAVQPQELPEATPSDPPAGPPSQAASGGDNPPPTRQIGPDPINFGTKPNVTVDSSILEALMVQARKGQEAYERLNEVENQRVLDVALAEGKFPPARRDAWDNYMKHDPEGARKALAELMPGLVPVTEIGQIGNPDYSVPAYPIELFPEIRKRKEREEMITAGLVSRSRVQTDGTMRRGGILRAS